MREKSEPHSAVGIRRKLKWFLGWECYRMNIVGSHWVAENNTNKLKWFSLISHKKIKIKKGNMPIKISSSYLLIGVHWRWMVTAGWNHLLKGRAEYIQASSQEEGIWCDSVWRFRVRDIKTRTDSFNTHSWCLPWARLCARPGDTRTKPCAHKEGSSGNTFKA